MHPVARVDDVLRFAQEGRTTTEVARLTGLPRSTVRDWLNGATPRKAVRDERASTGECRTCQGPEHAFTALPGEYMYALGLYLGDGCISAHPRGVFKLRIFLDASYPGIIDSCEAAIRKLRPNNRIARLPRSGGFANSSERSNIEISAYSRSWPCLFPQHGPGRKHERPIVLVDWQRDLLERHPEALLRGLIHSDGCRFINRGTNWRHPRYSFSNASGDIRRIFCEACDVLGLRWTTAPRTVYVSRKDDVERLDRFIGPKA
jgi:Homeodomain-like domain-containing protein